MKCHFDFARKIALGLAAFAVSACQSGSIGGPSETQTVFEREIGEYRLEAGDEVKVFVLNEPDLSDDYIIDGSGTISLPLIGEVLVRGKTLRELDTQITARLADGFLRSPDVSVELLNYPPYYILGEVNKPGQYDYAEDLTVLKAVATAQGFTHRANQKVIVIRGADDAEEVRVALQADTRVLPGDTIRILERFF